MRVRSQHNRRQRRLLRAVFVTGVVLLLALLLPRAASFVVQTALQPIHATVGWWQRSEAVLPNLFRERARLTDEIATLEQQVAELSQADLTRQRLFTENQRLRSLLGVTTSNRIAAGVIARPPELPYDLLQIDQGAQAGVAVGAPVFIGADQVIGQVVHVAPQYAFVELITTANVRATAFITGPDLIAEVVGLGGGVARVRVPQGVPLREGDLVQLPSIEPGIFGRITLVENRPTQPEQYGYIALPIPLQSLHTVAVGQRSQVSASPAVIEARVREELRDRLRVPVTVPEVSTTSTEFATSTATTS